MSTALPSLNSISAEGLLSFGEQTTVEFGRLTILVGANGSGKSNLLNLIRMFRNTPFDFQETFKDSGFEDWVFRSKRDTVLSDATLTVTVPGSELPVEHHLRLSQGKHGGTSLVERIYSRSQGQTVIPFFSNVRGSRQLLETSIEHPTISKRSRSTQIVLRLTEEEFDPTQSILSQVKDIRRFPQLTRLANYYGDVRIYSDWTFGRASNLRASSDAASWGGQLAESTDNLAISLNALQGSQTHDQIRSYLNELKPTYRDFITRVIFGRVGLEMQESSFEKPLPAMRLSDGTLRFLALLAILCNPKPSSVICLEEPELGMHPDMINLIARVIVEASSRTQIVLTTHSERLLSCLQGDFDRLVAFDANELGTSVQSLSQSDYKSWRSDHDLGDLWSSGELGGVRY